MKKPLIILVCLWSMLFFSKDLIGQNGYSTVHIINKSRSCSIYFNDKIVAGLDKGEVLEYKLWSKGPLAIAGLYATSRAMASIEVDGISDYYILMYYWNDNFGQAKVVDQKKWNSNADKPSRIVKLEENLSNPFGTIDESRKSAKGQGTCFLISTNGYLITNNHCVNNAKEITVKGIDGDFTTKYGASVVGTDPSNDLALLKLGNKNLKFNASPYAIRSNGVAQAEKVYALGFPAAKAMGEEVKITEGIISSKSGAGNDISKFQISAAVNPGNSGGPLIDEQGNLIGVIYAKSTIAESAGYAIKASYLETFLKNVDGFEMPNLTNTIKDKPLTDKVAEWKKFIFIVEAN